MSVFRENELQIDNSWYVGVYTNFCRDIVLECLKCLEVTGIKSNFFGR